MAGLRQRLWPRRRVEPGHDEKSARILTMKDELPTERYLMAFTHSSQIFTTPDIPRDATYSLIPRERELGYAGERQSIRAHGLYRRCRG